MTRPLHPRHGTHQPRLAVPPRQPVSIRRTTTHDATRPEGLDGLVVEVARGADTFTDERGNAHRLATAEVTARIDGRNGHRLTDIGANPVDERITSLVGHGVISGFRARVAAAIPDAQGSGSLTAQLLDDLPGAVLVSGVALLAAQRLDALRTAPSATRRPLQSVGMCAGFQPGSALAAAILGDDLPPIPTGPAAPPLLVADDPFAWHELRPLAIHDVRRTRMLDVVPGTDGGPIEVSAYFRDSHLSADPALGETVIHEYTVRATLDPTATTILDSEAVAHTLPWLECSDAVGSAARLAGQRLGTIRRAVSDGFTGVTTCTHLNDTMRSLDDVGGLLRMWSEQRR